MKIAVLISSLRCGGTERTVSLLANSWVESGSEVEIFTLSGPEITPFFSLDSRVRHTPLDLQGSSASKVHGLWNNFKRVYRIRKALRNSRPDIFVAFMEGTTALAILATRGTSIPVIISEVAVPELQSGGFLWNALRKLLYPRAELLIVPSRGVQEFFSKRLGLSCEVIPNPVAAPKEIASEKVPSKHLIAVGRLSPEKGFNDLLAAFANVKATHQDANLTIFGEGPLRENLLTTRNNLGLQDSVFFPGTTADLAQELVKADIFVLSSKYEGFGNVLCEAMAVGLPVVSFDCPTGPREIIRHGVDGLLVPVGNIDKLAEVVSNLLSDLTRRKELASRAPEILQRFGLAQIAQQWLMAFERILHPTADASVPKVLI